MDGKFLICKSLVQRIRGINGLFSRSHALRGNAFLDALRRILAGVQTMQLSFNQIVTKPGQNLLLKDINWQRFETLLDELGEKRAARLSYSKGNLEIMVPLAVHEVCKEIIGNL